MNWRRQAGVLALYGALTLIMTMPVVLNLSTYVAGQGGDPWQTMWRFEDEWRNRDIERLFGGGEPRLVNIAVWPWMWLHVMLGQPTAYNIVWLLSYVLSGYFMYGLVRYLTKHETAAILAGGLYMFLPYHVAHSMGHFGAMQMQWLPLAILLLFLFIRQPTIGRTLGLAGAVVLQSWTEHHYMLWLAIFAVVLWASAKFKVQSAKLKSVSPYIFLLSALVFFFAILPWWPMVKLAMQPSDILSLGTEQTIRFSADVFAYVTPPAWQPIWGGVAQEWYGRHFTGNLIEATQFLGWVPLLLIAFFHQHVPRKQKLFWLLVAAVFLVISFGPRLHVFGRVLPLPLPYALVDEWPVFSAVRAVARAGALVGLATSVLFGWVLAKEMRRPITVALVAALVVVEFLFLPVAMAEVRLSRAYEEIARLPGQRLVEIPAATNYTVGSQALYASLVHGKEIVGNGALERAEGSAGVAEARTLPGLRQLLFLRTDQLLENRADFFNQDLAETLPDVLRYLDADAIAVRVNSLSAKQREAVEYFLEASMGWVPEKYGDVVLYRTGTTPGVESDGVFLVRDRAWQNVGFDSRRGSVFAEITRRATVTLHNVSDKPRTVELVFTIERGAVSVSEGSAPLRQASAGQVRVSVMVQPGAKVVTWRNLLPETVIIRDPKLIVR